MDLGLTGKAVIVLGASRGLGFATAREFAREGANVVIASRDAATLARAAGDIRQATGREVLHQPCDVTRPEALQAVADFAVQRLGGIDVLVTNGGGPPAGAFDNFDDAAWQRAFELNLLSAVRAIRLALPAMKARGGGRIVCLASVASRQPIDGLILSNVFRAGVAGLAKSLANELASHGILVNTICPGRISTERVAELDAFIAGQRGTSPEAVREGFERLIPLGRCGTPEEFARALVWLGSWANTFITGQMLLVDGGLVRAL
jgi:3-oxoacyl-[acyl-carrier protein] reductase